LEIPESAEMMVSFNKAVGMKSMRTTQAVNQVVLEKMQPNSDIGI